MFLNRGLLLILLLALALRAVVVFREAEHPLVGDELSYDSIALNVAEGRGFQSGDTDADRHVTAMRGPAYVLFLAAFYRIAGHHLLPPLMAQALLDVLSCWLAYVLAERWFKRRGPALIAALIVASYPPFITGTGQLLTEPFTTATLLLSILAFFHYVERDRTASLVLAGFALGLCSLGKPQLGAVGLVLAFAAGPRIGWPRALRAAAVLTLVVAGAMAPWIVRNARVFHAFVPGVTQGGISFWGGTAPFHNRIVGGMGDPWVPDSLRQSLNRLNEVEASRWFYRDGLRIIAEDPVRYAGLSVRKVFQLWLNLLFDDPPSRASLLLAVAHVVAFAFAGLGMLRAGADPIATRLVLALVIYWTALHVPFVAQVRYAYPCLPLLFCFTAGGICELPPLARSRLHTTAVRP